jgi:Arc/MetJ-type ribon-helix-helix transcriptional regulator
MTTKIAVSLPDDIVAAARHAVADGQAASVSAFVSEAIREHGRYANLSQLLAEMAAEGGMPTPEDRIWARQALGIDEP